MIGCNYLPPAQGVVLTFAENMIRTFFEKDIMINHTFGKLPLGGGGVNSYDWFKNTKDASKH